MSGPMQGPVAVYRGSFTEAGLIRGYLEAHDIQATLENPAVGGMVPQYVAPAGVGPVGVMIAKKDVRRARVLIESYLKGRVKVTQSAAREAQSIRMPTLSPIATSGPRTFLWAVAALLIAIWIGQSGYLRRILFRAPTQEEIRKAQLVSAQHTAFVVGKAGVEWVRIPGGTFYMGSGRGDEWPVHKVTVKSFDMARTLVTVAQYRSCVDAGVCTPPLRPDDSNWSVPGRDDHPMNAITWEQASAFAAWVGGRLPSEAEWEYAARSAGKDYAFPWGNEDATCERAVIFGDGNLLIRGEFGCGLKSTWPVCAKPAGISEQGLCDMIGNTWEWVADRYHRSYDGAPADGRVWDKPTHLFERVMRGGSWVRTANFVRATRRTGYSPLSYDDTIGFRPARDVGH